MRDRFKPIIINKVERAVDNFTAVCACTLSVLTSIDYSFHVREIGWCCGWTVGLTNCIGLKNGLSTRAVAVTSAEQ